MGDTGFDHITIGVSDLDHARAFYRAALAPLGIEELYVLEGDAAGFGLERPWFWISKREGVVQGATHVAFVAPNRATVTAFHVAAIAAGGRDFGAPGPRPHYDEHYWAAFILDHDGHNIEAVCRCAP